MLFTLKRFGFNDSFVNSVKTMYTDIQTCVINNGWISEMFRNTRGIRHGRPLSAVCAVSRNHGTESLIHRCQF